MPRESAQRDSFTASQGRRLWLDGCYVYRGWYVQRVDRRYQRSYPGVWWYVSPPLPAAEQTEGRLWDDASDVYRTKRQALEAIDGWYDEHNQRP